MGPMLNEMSRADFGEVVALVPAKLTSVRIPRKNIADLCGNPMFFYSVRAAQLCHNIDAVYVSSEATEILELAADYGAETIIRPMQLSAPHVTNLEVLCHALNEITQRQGALPELIVLLQPTHPLRKPQLISEGIKKMQADPTADTLLTVVHTNELRGEICNGRFIPEFPLPRNKESEPKLYRNTGSLYIFRVANTLAQGRLFSESIIPLIIDNPEFEVDVDEMHDLSFTRSLLESNRKKFAEFFSQELIL